jgi:hypothetical protein
VQTCPHRETLGLAGLGCRSHGMAVLGQGQLLVLELAHPLQVSLKQLHGLNLVGAGAGAAMFWQCLIHPQLSGEG